MTDTTNNTKPIRKSTMKHPRYSEMVIAAISNQDKNRCSRREIIKYIISNYNVGNKIQFIKLHVKRALNVWVMKGILSETRRCSGHVSTNKRKLMHKMKKTGKVMPSKLDNLKTTET